MAITLFENGVVRIPTGEIIAGTILLDTTGNPLTIGGAGGTSSTDDGAFTAGVSSLTPSGGVVTADSVDSGDAGAFAMLANRQQKITLYDSSGAEITSFGGGTEYTVNAVVPANPVGSTWVMERDDALSALTEIEGDWTQPRSNANGALWVKHDGTLTVDGSGVTQPVSHAGLTALNGAIAGTEVQVDVLTMPTITVNAHAVTNAGTFVVQVDGNALTALQLIDDIVYTDDTSTHATGTSKGALFMAAATPTDSAVNANDIGAVAMTTDRKLHVSVQDALPAGTNAIGKLSANSGVDIGDVTIDNAAGAAAVNIQDGGNSITVDGTVAATQSGTWTVRLSDGTDTADVLDLTNSNPLTVAIVDGDGTQITSFGGGTQYTEDAAAAADPVGTAPILVRKDTPAATVTTDGDNIAQRGTNFGAAYVTLLDASGNAVAVGGGTQYAIDSVASATATGTVALVVRKDAAATLAGTDGDITGLQVDAAGALRVTGGGGGTEYVVNAVAPADPTGATWVMERDDALSALTEIEGDWTQPRANANGALWVKHDGTMVVDGSGVTQPVSHGALTELAAAINASSQMDVNIAASAATLTVASHAVTNAGTFVVQENGAALTALQLIDDPVATLGTTTYTEAATKGMIVGAVRRDADTTLVDTTNEVGPLQMDANGRLKVEVFSGETLPVSGTVTAAQGTAANLNMTEASAAAILTSVQLIDDIVYVDDTATHATGTSKGALFMAAAVPTDTSVSANDIGAVAMTTDRKLHVSVQDALPAGTANIGDVDVLTVPTDPFGANADAASATGSISAKLRFIAATGIPITGTVTVGSHAVTNAGTFAVQVDGSALTSLQLLDDAVFTDDAAFTPGTSKGLAVGLQADESSTDSVDEGDFGIPRMTLDRKVIATIQPHTKGGLTTFMASGSDGSSILVATKQTIKASAGQLYGYYFYNPEAAVSFVHIYNTDTVTVGTTNPQLTIAIPAGAAANLAIPQGVLFDTAMSCSATTTAGGNTAPATGVSAVFWYA